MGFDFLSVGSLPCPEISAAEAVAFVAERFDLRVRAEPLGSQQDRNFLLTKADGEVAGVLKIANPAFSAAELDAQDAVAAHLVDRAPQLRVGGLLIRDGVPLLAMMSTPTGPARARVLRFLPGGSLAGPQYLAPAVVAGIGAVAGTVSRALSDFHHAGLERRLQWDSRYADRVVALLIEHVTDPDQRARLGRTAADAWAKVTGLDADLPRQAVHLDVTDDNVVCAVGSSLPDGVIDFGDVTTSWAVTELVAGVASVLFHDGAEPASVLPLVRAFHTERPLTSTEATALWPLTILRAVVLVVSGLQQLVLDGAANTYVADSLERQWRAAEQVLSIPEPVMTALLRHETGHQRPPLLASGWAARLEPTRVTTLDLSPTSDAMDTGAWLDPDYADRLAVAALDAGAAAVTTAFGRVQLPAARPLLTTSPATISTGVDIWFAEPTPMTAPWDGELSGPDRLLLTGPDGTLAVDGLKAPERSVVAGEHLVTVPPRTRTRLTIYSGDPPPPFVRPEYAAGWLSALADPAVVLGLAVVPPDQPTDLLIRRMATVAAVQEHYYAAPPRIERGWRHHLVDVEGRVYLDMVNNVAAVGHAHPGVSDAVARQLRRLNTNSRFHYSVLVDLAERLTNLLPESLDTVFFVNSGSEAVDLALRLATAATGRPDIVAVREAYHGWTYYADAVSTSVSDNPDALATRPDWVHVLDAPNTYRGRHLGPEVGRYAEDAVTRIDDLARLGRAPAAFIAEAYYGNAGGMALPDGYLAQIYATVRGHGGLAIADETQVGYGRLGTWFWGFEQQAVVPDILTMAKAMGNGHPLGAVITTRAIADQLSRQGYFFSSTGGSPVSAVAGLAVLDALRAEGLMANAATVGAHLKGRLQHLQEQHNIIGAVHGSGLYLGVEFVRDRTTREPASSETMAICDRLRELGVIMQPTSERLNVLKIKPPLCLDLAGADYFADTLGQVLTEGW